MSKKVDEEEVLSKEDWSTEPRHSMVEDGSPYSTH